jgi:hypothetical protein
MVLKMRICNGALLEHKLSTLPGSNFEANGFSKQWTRKLEALGAHMQPSESRDVRIACCNQTVLQGSPVLKNLDMARIACS